MLARWDRRLTNRERLQVRVVKDNRLAASLPIPRVIQTLMRRADPGGRIVGPVGDCRAQQVLRRYA